MELLCLFAFVLVGVLLIERPWRNVHLHVFVERRIASDLTSDSQVGVEHANPEPLTHDQILQVHEEGRLLGRQEMMFQVAAPSSN